LAGGMAVPFPTVFQFIRRNSPFQEIAGLRSFPPAVGALLNIDRS
jgi:hypothetical protein